MKCQCSYFIGSCGINLRQLQAFLDDIENEYDDILYYCEVSWLSRGKVLQHFLSLLEETKVFPVGKGKPVILKIQVLYVIWPSSQTVEWPKQQAVREMPT
jgi:hypothetical protein